MNMQFKLEIWELAPYNSVSQIYYTTPMIGLMLLQHLSLSTRIKTYACKSRVSSPKTITGKEKVWQLGDFMTTKCSWGSQSAIQEILPCKVQTWTSEPGRRWGKKGGKQPKIASRSLSRPLEAVQEE